MRLLNTSSLELREFLDSDIPGYAILSHTWESEEVTLKDLSDPHSQTKKGFSKIRACCAQARKDEHEWVWIDTCCIDKTSSAELSEAINSMFLWYKKAKACYVYLSDLPAQLPGELDLTAFRVVRWFTRGWTLQELIAPRYIEFFDQNWNEIGTKLSLANLIAEITGIRTSVLRGKEAVSSVSVAERMCWAAERETSRREDVAYCLLGIFDIQMPLLYGEGSKAFIRLQQEILRVSEDSTIFLWTTTNGWESGVLATNPSGFSGINLTCEGSREVISLGPEWKFVHTADPSVGPSIRFEFESSTSPPTITSRGLLVNWPYFHRTTSRGSRVFLWTGYCIDTGSLGKQIAGYLCLKVIPANGSSNNLDSSFVRKNSDRLYCVPGDGKNSFVQGRPFYLTMASPAVEQHRFLSFTLGLINKYGISWKQHQYFDLTFYGYRPPSPSTHESEIPGDYWAMTSGGKAELHVGLVGKMKRFDTPEAYDVVIGISSQWDRGPFICFATAEHGLKQTVLGESSRLGTSPTLTQLVDDAQTDRLSVHLPDNKHILLVAFRSTAYFYPLLTLEVRPLQEKLQVSEWESTVESTWQQHMGA
ncbi:het domain protein [Colletotrichum plurivorum]|uniref:Het domain protein n=1 Tax=Colletotrichum plurivorum TaxID=2175906 RepID=A0A8H6MXF9_9PEZI|nr:het domain protein [Colletotrichum plurivorum]